MRPKNVDQKGPSEVGHDLVCHGRRFRPRGDGPAGRRHTRVWYPAPRAVLMALRPHVTSAFLFAFFCSAFLTCTPRTLCVFQVDEQRLSRWRLAPCASLAPIDSRSPAILVPWAVGAVTPTYGRCSRAHHNASLIVLVLKPNTKVFPFFFIFVALAFL